VIDWFIKHFLTLSAAFLWLAAALAAVDMVWGGNPTAVNGVVGGGIAAIFCTAAAVLWRRLLRLDS